MESNCRLLYKSNNTHLRTSLPVYFYGLPDSNIYLIYARFYEINFNKSGLEFVFAVLKNYYYEFETEKIATLKGVDTALSLFRKEVEYKEPQLRIVKCYRNIKSFVEAQKFLEKKANEIVNTFFKIKN
ncbi:hypothetical protein [Maribellus maritimus]|uniref:hypothetical protein n=1 Tax=Maribellus maritimus TaxID=2870838 RepID=UPI001EEC069D|nr:hypothetical protein [Maribellus maritimus]MCG6189654.1 hypothetical protein [Maribellus maritimus]